MNEGAPRIAAGRIDTAYATVALLMLASVLPFFIGGQVMRQPSELDVLEQGDEVKQLILLGLYVVGGVLLVRRRALASVGLLGLPLLLLLGWSFVSIGWSTFPDGTLRRAIAVSGATLVGFFLGLRFDTRDLARVFWAVAAMATISSLAAGVLLDTGVDLEGRLRGLFAHKNLLGSFAAIAIVMLLTGWCDANGAGLKRHLLDLALIAACIACLVLSDSATPLIALGAALLVLAVLRVALSSQGGLWAIAPAGLACMAVAAFVVWASMDDIAALLGRDPTLSGRSYIWEFVLSMIGKRPWLGYGYGVFWLGDNAPAAAFWHYAHHYELHAHNGYLQLVLDVGGIGCALFAAILVPLVSRFVFLARQRTTPYLLWHGAFLVFFLVYNLSENRIWVGNDLFTTLFVYSIVRTNLEYRIARTG